MWVVSWVDWWVVVKADCLVDKRVVWKAVLWVVLMDVMWVDSMVESTDALPVAERVAWSVVE